MFSNKKEILSRIERAGRVPGLVVLDERLSDLDAILLKIVALELRHRPLILILVQERQEGDLERTIECDCVERYSELGAELYLHVPRGVSDPERKLKEAG